jgi:hypothetical protein
MPAVFNMLITAVIVHDPRYVIPAKAGAGMTWGRERLQHVDHIINPVVLHHRHRRLHF